MYGNMQECTYMVFENNLTTNWLVTYCNYQDNCRKYLSQFIFFNGKNYFVTLIILKSYLQTGSIFTLWVIRFIITPFWALKALNVSKKGALSCFGKANDVKRWALRAFEHDSQEFHNDEIEDYNCDRFYALSKLISPDRHKDSRGKRDVCCISSGKASVQSLSLHVTTTLPKNKWFHGCPLLTLIDRDQLLTLR